MIPQKYTPILFGLILSGMMSFIVSGIATVRAVGFVSDFPLSWMAAWLTSWSVAFPAVLVLAPLTRKLVTHLTVPE